MSLTMAAIFLLSAKTAYAVSVGVPINGNSSFTYSTYVKALYSFSLIMGENLAGLMIVYAGYIYLTSQGDTSKINTAKEIVTGAILGLLILWLIKLILQFIGLPSITN